MLLMASPLQLQKLTFWMVSQVMLVNFNTLDGITASTAELNQLVGKTISTTFTPANSERHPD